MYGVFGREITRYTVYVHSSGQPYMFLVDMEGIVDRCV